MNVLMLAIVFFAAAGVSLTYGVGRAFAIVYLPALLLLAPVAPMELSYLPDLDAQFAAMYGILIGSVGDGFAAYKFKWRACDWIVLGLGVSAVMTAVTTEHIYTGVSEAGYQTLGWLLPYFVARVAFYDASLRALVLRVLIVVCCVHAVFGLIEMRLWPHFYLRVMGMLQLTGDVGQRMAYGRFGFFRAESAFRHPIFFGNACVTMFGLIVALGRTSAGGVSRRWVRGGAIAAAIGLVTSLSFSSYNGAAACALCFAAIYLAPHVARSLMVPGVVAVALALAAFTAYTASQPPGPKPEEGTLASSYYTRQVIIQNSWKLVSTSGPFGHGKVIDKSQLDLDSVDNTYMLFGMVRGWVYLGLWIVLPIVAVGVAARAMKWCRSDYERLPIAMCAAITVGIAMAVYTVWAGYHGMPYTLMWLFAIALIVSLEDALRARVLGVPLFSEATGAPAGRARRLSRGRATAPQPTPARQSGAPVVAASSDRPPARGAGR